jgi:adenylate cyclase
MTRPTRVRRDWQIIFWLSVGIAVLSVSFGLIVRQSSALHAAMLGLASSLVIATPIIVFEVIGRRSAALKGLKRRPLLVYFGLSVLFYVVVIVGGLVLVRLLVDGTLAFDRIFRNSVIFAVAMSVLSNLTVAIGFLLGFGTLLRLLTGRYVHPRLEEKTFLLIDMKDSTGVAERLGPIRFHELLNEFFRDVTAAAIECGAEVHKFVGDEAILTWSGGAALADGACLACPFIARDLIATKGRHYRERFGAMPEFRAALHCGEIVAGEIGDIRREIAYVGDTLNVAARLLEAAKELGRDVLASADLLERATVPPDLQAEPLPTLTVRGRAAPLAISALHRSAAAG